MKTREAANLQRMRGGIQDILLEHRLDCRALRDLSFDLFFAVDLMSLPAGAH